MKPDKTGGVLGVFEHLDRFTHAIRALKEAGEDSFEVFSPVPSHEIDEALGQKPSRLGYATLAGAIVGLASGISLAAFTALKYDLITGGKPLVAWISWFVVGFEFTILFGCLANFLAMLVFSGLPRFKRSPGYDERFSVDAFGLFVTCRSGEAERLKSLFTKHGALEVHERF